MGGPILTDTWCYSCDSKTIHEVRLISELNFVGKSMVWRNGQGASDRSCGSCRMIGAYDGEDYDWTDGETLDEDDEL